MPIDTSISRVSSPDSNAALNRKKANSDTIDVSKLSFFDELLNISQFASAIPDGPVLPPGPPVTSQAAQDSDSSSEKIDEASGEKTEEDDSINDESNVADAQVIVQQQVVVQPTLQTNNADVKTDKVDHAETVQGVSNQKQVQTGETQNATAGSNKIDSNSVNTSSETEVEANLQDTQGLNSQPEIAVSATQDSLPKDLESQANDDEGQNPILSTDDAKNPKPIQKGRASADSSEENKDESQSGPDISLLTPVQSDEKGLADKTLKELQPTTERVEQSDELDEAAIDTDQPRNRRSERLAELASSNDSSSDERDQASESPQSLESNVTTVANGTATEESFLSATTSSNQLAVATTITPSFAPALPNINTFNNTSINATTNTRSATDGVSAVTASATSGGSQTGTTNTTISGTSPTTSRSDAARGEVARSNSGTQITAYQEGKLVQRVLRGVEQLANGGGQVRLRLHPAELGSLQISLRVEAGQVSAKLEVENSTAREALLNNVQTLKDRLAEQGIKVASFEVEVSADSSGSGTANPSFQGDGRSNGQAYRENAESRFAQQNSNRIANDAVPPERTPPAAWTRNAGSLDLTV